MSLADAHWTGWVYPLPTLGDDRAATISDGFSTEKTSEHRQHLGVDVMYRRRPHEPAELPRGTKLFYVPANTPVLAAFGGKIWKASVTDYGHSVAIDHGNAPDIGPAVTFYQHMASFSRPWKKGDVVRAGDELGIVGGSLVGYPLQHLHFELWLPTRDKVVDPEPYMAKWMRRRTHQIADRSDFGASYGLTDLKQDLRQVVERAERGGRGVLLPVVIGGGLLVAGILFARHTKEKLI